MRFSLAFFATLALLFFALPNESEASLQVFTAGMVAHTYITAVFTGSAFVAIAFTATIFIISRAYEHRTDTEEQHFFSLLFYLANIYLGALLGKLQFSLFRFPIMIKANDVVLKIMKNCCESAQSKWAFLCTVIAAGLGAVAYFTLIGDSDNVWSRGQSVPIAIALAVVAGILFVGGIWSLLYYGQGLTVKYIFALAMYQIAPYFYDHLLSLSPISRGFLMMLIWFVLSILFYFYTSLFRDRLFTRSTHGDRRNDAMWLSILLFLSLSMIYMAQGIINSQTDSVFQAFLTNIIVVFIITAMYIGVYTSKLYRGYTCCKCFCDHCTSKGDGGTTLLQCTHC